MRIIFHWNAEDMPLTEAIGNMLVRGVPASLSTSVIVLLCRPGLRVIVAVIELEP